MAKKKPAAKRQDEPIQWISDKPEKILAQIEELSPDEQAVLYGLLIVNTKSSIGRMMLKTQEFARDFVKLFSEERTTNKTLKTKLARYHPKQYEKRDSIIAQMLTENRTCVAIAKHLLPDYPDITSDQVRAVKHRLKTKKS